MVEFKLFCGKLVVQGALVDCLEMYINIFLTLVVLDFFGLLPVKTLLTQIITLFPVLYAKPVCTGLDVFEFKHKFTSRVYPGDLDLFCHKNNIKYVGRCEYGRMCLIRDCGIAQYVRKENIHMGFSQISLKFRRELKAFQTFTVESKIVGWDERSFYLEQKFVSGDNFVHCHSYSVLKLSSRGKASETTPVEILSNVAKLNINQVKSVCKEKSLESLVELHNLSKKNSISSRKIK